MRTTEDYMLLEEIALKDIIVLKAKGKGYGRSWIKRGGVGAFMMFARKWDRIENVSEAYGYNVINAVKMGDADLLDDIQDLRRYLLLLEGELIASAAEDRQKQAEQELLQQSSQLGSDSELQMRAQPRPGQRRLDSEALRPSRSDELGRNSSE